ncbi:uncharacterized protein LOC111285464 [Durio zibethinus]|uniref:Uncharacterized protein LOC111285464 n=1 Tax=Durio zibethinus TaxID=66656 RepID=A0A6P5XR44_DURZI|nr:uncharacterized protein LOC111285464 [Durio zibethinus]
MGELPNALGGVRSTSAHLDLINPAVCKPQARDHDDFMLRALTAVFGIDQTDGRTNKKARQVVQKLGLVDQPGEDEQDSTTNFDLLGGGWLEDKAPVEEVLGVGRLMEDR